MEFKKKTLSNGLTVIGEVNKSAKSAAVGFFVKTGARDETKQINGVSHFLEHMVFKGTNRLSAAEVNKAFDKTGAQFNASTSEENTIYYAAVLPEYLVEITQLWIELMRPSLRKKDFNIEKNVIKEEIAMYKDTPWYDVMDKCRGLHFDGHPLGNSVLGTEQTIEKLTIEQMRDYFQHGYAPNNMVLACSGNFNWDELCSIIVKGCGKWQNHPIVRTLQDPLGSKVKKRIEKPNLSCEHICLISRGTSAQDRRRFAASLLAVIIGDNTGSRYFWELIETAMAETASMQFDEMDGTGLFCSYIRCNSKKTEDVLNKTNDIFKDISKCGISEDELTKAKNKVLSALVIKNELPMGRLLDIGLNWVYLKEYLTVPNEINAITSVSISEINALIKELTLGSFTQLSIGPPKSI